MLAIILNETTFIITTDNNMFQKCGSITKLNYCYRHVPVEGSGGAVLSQRQFPVPRKLVPGGDLPGGPQRVFLPMWVHTTLSQHRGAGAAELDPGLTLGAWGQRHLPCEVQK